MYHSGPASLLIHTQIAANPVARPCRPARRAAGDLLMRKSITLKKLNSRTAAAKVYGSRAGLEPHVGRCVMHSASMHSVLAANSRTGILQGIDDTAVAQMKSIAELQAARLQACAPPRVYTGKACSDTVFLTFRSSWHDRSRQQSTVEQSARSAAALSGCAAACLPKVGALLSHAWVPHVRA